MRHLFLTQRRQNIIEILNSVLLSYSSIYLSGISTYPLAGGLLARQRACLLALLNKSSILFDSSYKHIHQILFYKTIEIFFFNLF